MHFAGAWCQRGCMRGPTFADLSLDLLPPADVFWSADGVFQGSVAVVVFAFEAWPVPFVGRRLKTWCSLCSARGITRCLRLRSGCNLVPPPRPALARPTIYCSMVSCTAYDTGPHAKT